MDSVLDDAAERATPSRRRHWWGTFASPAASAAATAADGRALRATSDGVEAPTYTLRRGGAGGNDTVMAAGPLAPRARTYRPATLAGLALQPVVRVPVGESVAAAAGVPAPAGVVAVSLGSGAV